MKIATLGIVIAALSFSCQKDGKPSEKISAAASDSLAAVKASEANITNTPAPVVQNQQVVTTANPVNVPATPITKPGMNPPHGQPGHRCDIAVGAPLNSKPTNAPSTQATRYTIPKPTDQGQATTTNNNAVPAILQPNTPPTPAKPQTTLAGMQGKPNPAHGQEGHRCDVKVGDPLP
ncbi:hypothetical protein ABGT15_10150 [Flavobacterium enshiense]|uniref:hypothetical protein n=1 Tax=Flavobacterium enshiense TaxID=1341165 RepID=UPI00345D3A68